MKTYWITALLAIAMTAGAEDTITLKVKVKDGLFYPDRLTAPAGKTIKLEIDNISQDAVEFESVDLRQEELLPAGTQSSIEILPLRPGQYRFFDDLHKGAVQGVLLIN